MNEEREERENSLVSSESLEAIIIDFQSALVRLRNACESVMEKQEVHMNLIKLRECNRSLSLLVRNKKKHVQQAKNALDRAELVRQNLLYQKNHLRATIDDTRRHDCIYLTVILGTTESFMDMDEHESMLNGLRKELEERKQLAERLKANQDSLELAKSRLVLKRKELEKLRDQLESIVRSADPFLSSHSRIFADLVQKPSQLESYPNEEVPGGVSRTIPLEVLAQHLLNYAEHSEDVSVRYFDEVEPGEDIGEEEEETMTSPSIDERTIGRSHLRFVSHSSKLGSRKFSFAHILVELKVDNDEVIKLYVFSVANGSLIALQIESSTQVMEKNETESFLLSLPIESSLLLTSSHDTIVAGEAGYVPFRWLQCLSGIAPHDSAYDNPLAILDKFFSAIRIQFTLISAHSDTTMDQQS